MTSAAGQLTAVADAAVELRGEPAERRPEPVAWAHERALNEYVGRRAEFAREVQKEMQHEAGRAEVKAQAIRRLMDGDANPLTGKPHSASSAEAIVETDPEYAAYLAAGREIVRRKMWAQTDAEVALETARMIRTLAGVEAR